MGLPQLWDIIHDHEQRVPIAQLAEEHHQRHGKALRIAVDEADWRFNNLTQAQVYAIRDASNEPAFQGIEKAMFYRICRLLTLNIQLIFVFDGPGRPWKRGKRGGGKIDYEKRRLLQQMLTCFGIPYHEAPGEAEAECARLQVLGLVDAVWSQDSDCLMFGCTLWIHDDRVAKENGNVDRSKENTKKNAKFVRVVQARQMEDEFGLDREGLVLFAMLVGGDYQTSGLPGCGIATAMHAVKTGLGRALCSCRNQRDCSVWSIQLAEFLRTTPRAKNIFVPGDFPDFKVLQKYSNPKVSSDDVLRNSSRLNLGYDRPIQEIKLLEVTSSRFNVWGRKYMDWVGPVLLTKYLAQRDSTLPHKVVHDIKFIKRRVKKTDDQPATRCFERKLTFSPFGVTSLRKADFEGDRLGYWNGDRATLFDPGHRVECEIPDYWLQKTIPQDVIEPPPKEPKRKRETDADVEYNETSTATKRKRKHNEGDLVPGQVLPSARSSKSRQDAEHDQASATPSQRYKQQLATRERLLLIELSDSEDDDELRLPSRVRPQAPTSIRSAISQIIDLGSPSPSDDDEVSFTYNQHNTDTPSRTFQHVGVMPFDVLEREERDLQLALRLSIQEQQAASSPSLSRHRFDEIFALDDLTGIDNSSVSPRLPTLTGSRTYSTSIPAVPAQQIRAPLRSPLGSSAKDPIRHVTAAVPVGSLDQSYISPAAANPTILAATPTNISPFPVRGKEINILPPKPELADVRAARLRHFTAASASTNVTQLAEASPLSRAPNKLAKPTFHVPVEVECIDLTDD